MNRTSAYKIPTSKIIDGKEYVSSQVACESLACTVNMLPRWRKDGMPYEKIQGTYVHEWFATTGSGKL